VLHAREPVLRWEATPSGVRVQTTKDTYEAARLLLTAGAWNPALAGSLGPALKLTVTRQATAWFWPRRPEAFAEDRLPVWALSKDDGTIHYGFPMLADGNGGAGFKTAIHRLGEQTDPDHLDREPRAADEEPIRAFLRESLPEAQGPLLALRICMYTNTPDSHLLLDRHPEHENVFLASPCSGHGFKFASVVGEAVADLLTAGSTELPITFLRTTRFG